MGRAAAVRRVLAGACLVGASVYGPIATPARAAVAPGQSFTSLQPAPGSTGQAVLVLGDGSRLVAGSAGGDFALAHYAPSETLDAGFGGDGYVTTDFGGRTDLVRALASAAGSSVVAAGSSSGDVAVARYDAFGDLDRSFGTEGRVTTDVGSADDAAYGVVVQPTGKVVVAGGGGSSAFVLRYGVDGTPDPTFGVGGRVTLSWGSPARAIVAQPDGALVVVGSDPAGVAVVRLTADGVFDPGFGTSGTARLATGAGTSINAATLLADGRILVAGGRGGNVLLARLLPTGQADPTFGTSGVSDVDLGRTETANGVTMVPDGRIRVVGEATDGSGFDAAVLPSGVLDTAALSVRVTEPLHGITDGFGKLATVGTSNGVMASDTGGFTVQEGLDFSDVVQKAHGAARQADGRLVVVGETSGVIGLVRYTATGALDPSFGHGGKVVSDLAWFPGAVVVEADGRIVVAGLHRSAAALVGFRPDGTVDPTFGTAGRVLTTIDSGAPSALSILPDGHLLLGGGAGAGAFLARYSASGMPDPTFGDGGLIRSAFPGTGSSMYLVRQPDGETLATGVDASVSRFNHDGSPDQGFGIGGTVGMDTAEISGPSPNTLALQPDGRILVGGFTYLSRRRAFLMIRLNADGSPDPSWPPTPTVFDKSVDGSSGFHDDEVRQLFVQPDGRVLAVGDRVAARYRADGSLDETFGDGGKVYFANQVTDDVDSYFDADGLLWSVGSGGSPGIPSGFVVAVNRIPEPGRYHALAPARILDTRVGNGAPVGKVGPHTSLRLQVTGRGGVPSQGVSAVVLNLTVTEPTAGTFLTVFPANAQRPLASNLNVSAGQTLPNLVTVAVGADGGVYIYNDQGSSHLVADVAGWYGDGTELGGARYHPVSPSRVLDTRKGNGAPAAPVGPGSAIDLQVTGRGGIPAAGVSAVVLNVTAADPSAASYVTAWPTGQPRPLASNLNLAAGQTAPNLVAVAVGSGGRVSLFNSAGYVHLVADVAGWYGDGTEAGGSRFHAVSPQRLLDTRTGTGAPAGPIGAGAPLDLRVTGLAGVPVADVVAVTLNVTVTEPTASTYLTVWPSGEARPLASNLNFAPGQTVANLVTVAVGAGGRVSIFGGGGLTHVVVDVAGWYGG